MRITINVNMDNAAFEGEPGREAARILRRLADTLAAELEPGDCGALFDANGNRVGEWSVFVD